MNSSPGATAPPKGSGAWHWYRFLVVLAALAALALVACTVAYMLFEPTLSVRARWVLRFFDLSHENSLAGWYCGMLLLAISVFCYDGWQLNRRSQPRVARSWLLLALVMIAFSFDEMGSIHERLEELEYGILLGLLPAAVLVVAALWYVIAGFRAAPGHARVASWTLVAFVMYASVPAQELLELRYATTPMKRAVSIGLEEATEVLASTLLFAITVRNTFALRATSPGQLLALPFDARWLAIPVLVIVTPALAFLTAGFTDQFRGRPADWVVASALVFAGLAALRVAIEQGDLASLAAAAFFGVASMGVVFGPVETLTTDSLLSRRAVFIAVTLSVVALALSLGNSARPGAAAALLAGVVVYVAGYEAIKDNQAYGYVATQCLALAAYWLVTPDRFGRRQRALTTAP